MEFASENGYKIAFAQRIFKTDDDIVKVDTFTITPINIGMIKSQKVIVTLKPSIKAKINDLVITNLYLKTSEKDRTIRDWLKKDSEKLTHYSFLLALSELLQLPIDQLINIERC